MCGAIVASTHTHTDSIVCEQEWDGNKTNTRDFVVRVLRFVRVWASERI